VVIVAITSELQHFKDLCESVSPSYALRQLNTTITNKIGFAHLNRITYKSVNKYIRNMLEKCANSIDEAPRLIAKRQISLKPIIWTCWMQGEYNAPEIVQYCINSMRKFSPYEVKVIDKTNLINYIHFSDTIERKYNDGKISMTHLSDYIRFSLLANYGGVWLDSTVLVTNPIPECIFTLPVYTGHLHDYQESYKYADSHWTAFILGSTGSNPFFAFATALLEEYWEEYDILVDYYLIDHILSYCFSHHIGGNSLEQIPYIKNDIYWLQENALIEDFLPSEFLSNAVFNKLHYKILQDKKWSQNKKNILSQVIQKQFFKI
jgi:hypothetical protein